jgi:hypothetical protein
MVMNSWIPLKTGNFLTKKITVIFSRKNLPHNFCCFLIGVELGAKIPECILLKMTVAREVA